MVEQLVKPLSERAKLRLRLAAGLLRGKGGRGGRDLGFSRENFYEDIQRHLASLPQDEQRELRNLVDWLEDYETGGEGGGSG